MFWDLLYKRYGNPMMLLDQMIQAGRLAEFVLELVNIVNKENEEKTQWEYYLHKVFNQSFGEFLRTLKPTSEQPDIMTDEDIETTINNSLAILDNFVI